MNRLTRSIVLVACSTLMLSGCAEFGQRPIERRGLTEPTVVFRPTDCSYVLSCLGDLKSMRGKEFDLHFTAAKNRLASGDDRDKLRLICLALSARADYKQFKKGIEVLGQYIEEHPESGQDLQGLKLLVDRLDQAKINHWVMRRKLLDQQDEVERENERLKGELAQAQVKIKELQNQIEQLKNIENIIKNRER